MFSHEDEKYMRLALKLAEKGRGNTSPNPIVGCVVVKEGRIIGRGFHEKAGLPHAEVNALNEAGNNAAGADLYVTLEPCSHTGRTPPCSDRIIKEKLSRVVVAMKDPNPLVAGRGIEKLKKAGIKVETGLFEKDAKDLNEIFITYITEGRPFVTIKSAVTLDGKICTASGDSKWISGEKSREYVHRLRRHYDAILVGKNTLLNDDPALTSRLEQLHSPYRIVPDSRLELPETAKILTDEFKEKTIIAAALNAPKEKMERLKSRGITIIQTGETQVDLKALLKELHNREISSLLVEGGGTVNFSLLEQNLVDKILLFVAPKIVGGKGALTFVEGAGVPLMNEAFPMQLKGIETFGNDILLEYERPSRIEIGEG